MSTDENLFHAFFRPVLRSAMRSESCIVKPQRGGPLASGKLDMSDALLKDIVPQWVINQDSTCWRIPGLIAIAKIVVQYWKRKEDGRPWVAFHSWLEILKTEQQNAEKLRLTSLKEYSTKVSRSRHCRWLCLVVWTLSTPTNPVANWNAISNSGKHTCLMGASASSMLSSQLKTCSLPSKTKLRVSFVEASRTSVPTKIWSGGWYGSGAASTRWTLPNWMDKYATLAIWENICWCALWRDAISGDACCHTCWVCWGREKKACPAMWSAAMLPETIHDSASVRVWWSWCEKTLWTEKRWEMPLIMPSIWVQRSWSWSNNVHLNFPSKSCWNRSTTSWLSHQILVQRGNFLTNLTALRTA